MRKWVLIGVLLVLLGLCVCAAAEEEAEKWVACVDGDTIVIADAEEGLEPLSGALRLGVGEVRTILAPSEDAPLFASTNERCVSVSETGELRALSKGSASIRVYLSDGSVDIAVSVKDPPTRVRLGAKSGKLALGQTYQLKPKISGTGGVTWTSSDEDVAVVDRDGVISAVSVGKCVITCTTYNGKTAECSVTVVMPAPAKVELNAYKTQVYDGETFLLEATLNGGYRETVSFTSSDGNVARVDESGVVTAVKPGTAVIRAQASGGNYTNCVVEVLPGSTSIETDGAITLYAGGTMAVPARCVGGSGKYTVVSMNPDVALGSDGASVTALREGEADLYAITPNGEYACCHATVLARPEGLLLIPDHAEIAAGEQARVYVNGSDLPATFEIVGDDPAASVDGGGYVTGLKPGLAVVRARVGGVSVDAGIEVKPFADALSLSFSGGTLGVGDRARLTCALQNGAGRVTYVSDHPEILSVNGETGEIAAEAVGSATVTASIANGVKASLTLEVHPAPTEFALSERERVVGEGDRVRLSYRMNEGAGGMVSWTTDDEAVASVDENGELTAVAIGTTTVRATTRSLLTDSMTIRVVEAPRGLTVDAEPLPNGGRFQAYLRLTPGETAALHARCSGEAQTAFLYDSTLPAVAEVDETGVVRALSVGTTLVSVRIYTGETVNVLVEVAAEK